MYAQKWLPAAADAWNGGVLVQTSIDVARLPHPNSRMTVCGLGAASSRRSSTPTAKSNFTTKVVVIWLAMSTMLVLCAFGCPPSAGASSWGFFSQFSPHAEKAGASHHRHLDEALPTNNAGFAFATAPSTLHAVPGPRDAGLMENIASVLPRTSASVKVSLQVGIDEIIAKKLSPFLTL